MTNIIITRQLLQLTISHRRRISEYSRLKPFFGHFVIALMLLLNLLTACGKDEPGSLGSAPVVVSLHLDSTMVDYQVVDQDSRAGGLSSCLRCQVAAYAETSTGSVSEVPAAMQTITFMSGLNSECRMVLPSGRYRLVAWADYVDAGTTADKYYVTSDLGNISFKGQYMGNNDERNAYSGLTDFDFSVNLGDTTTVIYQSLALRSIMGKVKFVSTDYNKYIENEQSLRILVAYTGFLPNRYSVVRGMPFDATTGINFLSTMTEISTEGEGQATLGYDYVMVNGEESSVSMAIGLYDEEGSLVAASSNINVPIKRGGITVVKGHFLTKTSGGGGIGIDPSFEGDINVHF